MNDRGLSRPSRERVWGDVVERSCQRWEAKRQARVAQRNLPADRLLGFTIALSREAGARGTSVATEVGRLLGWPVYDHDLLERIARDMGVRATLLNSVDERQQGWLREVFTTLLSAVPDGGPESMVTEGAFVRHLVETVLALGAHGECVIVGRGAGFLLPPETTLRVRLIAPDDERARVMAKELGVTEHEAARRLRDLDREQTEFVRAHFFKDPTDPQNYDLLINTGRYSVSACAHLVVEALNRRQAEY
jgi:cytidylate kinase